MSAPQMDASPYGKSVLTQQLEEEITPRKPTSMRLTTPKPRSLSDATKPVLSPSPSFREPQRRMSKDDHDVSPSTPRRPNLHLRGLSLQMPNDSSTSIPQIAKIPLSPKLETSHIYGSPASMLPRHSRGLDFTRACTNLHHSTLADSTPDASPITGKGIQIPPRRGFGNNMDSPSTAAALWTTMPQEKTTLSSSVSSVNMLESDSDTDSSDDMALDKDDDPIVNTPAATRPAGFMNSPGNEWMYSPAQSSLMSFHANMMSYRRSKLRKGRGRSKTSSSSVSMRSSRPSPGPTSPPIMKSVENEGYFGLARQLKSRRESLSLGTDDLHLSDSEEGDIKTNHHTESEGPRGVVKRAVTRRSNLLPKTKGFARIKAALMEESAPIDSDQRREAEVMKQIESDTDFKRPSQISPPAPTVESVEDSQTTNDESSISTDSFSQHAQKNSAGLGFWNAFDVRYRTPPPTLLPRESSSGISDETMDTFSDNPALKHLARSRSRSTTPMAATGPTAEEIARKVNKKRRRDDDFDPASFKRRAVSPGMSVQSSPVLSQSPVLNGNKDWGRPPPKANGNGNDHGNRSNSTSSGSSGVKRIGLLGMSEANDGFMSMSID